MRPGGGHRRVVGSAVYPERVSIDRPAVRELISVVEEGPFGCRVWLGALSQDGRASVWDPDEQRSVAVLRVLWEDLWGPIPAGLMLCHQCHHRWCVDVGHVAVGSASANAIGMAAMERSAIGRGRGGGRGSLSRLPEHERSAVALTQAQSVRERHRQFGVQPPLFV